MHGPEATESFLDEMKGKCALDALRKRLAVVVPRGGMDGNRFRST